MHRFLYLCVFLIHTDTGRKVRECSHTTINIKLFKMTTQCGFNKLLVQYWKVFTFFFIFIKVIFHFSYTTYFIFIFFYIIYIYVCTISKCGLHNMIVIRETLLCLAQKPFLPVDNVKYFIATGHLCFWQQKYCYF